MTITASTKLNGVNIILIPYNLGLVSPYTHSADTTTSISSRNDNMAKETLNKTTETYGQEV